MSAPDLQRTFTGEIPRNYDQFLGPAWFSRHSAELARLMPADPGGDVLEIACGTGLFTEHLRKRLDPRRRLVATDLSAAMLDYARAKLASLEGITWQTADAGKLPFADGEFAAITCSFGVMFVPDRKAAFSEARRVLAPGGRFVFNVWDRIEDNPCALTYEEVIERMFPGDKDCTSGSLTCWRMSGWCAGSWTTRDSPPGESRRCACRCKCPRVISPLGRCAGRRAGSCSRSAAWNSMTRSAR